MTRNSARHLPRLQFSLRALLLSMAVVSAALTIYRWPWTEQRTVVDSFSDEGVETTTYRRGWNGKQVKHGLQTSEYLGPQGYRDEEFFVNDEAIWFATYFLGGELITKRHMRSGQLHGPYVDWCGKIVGEYRDGLRSGKWVQQIGDGRVIERTYVNGNNGRWEWKTNGQVIQSVTFNQDEIVLWNDSPVGEELQRWCETHNVPAITREVLRTPIDQVEPFNCLGSKGTVEFPLRNALDRPATHRLVLNHHQSYPVNEYPFVSGLDVDLLWIRTRMTPDQPAGEAFVIEALRRGRVIEFHFGVVSFVSYDKSQPSGADPTGINAIRFPVGSAEDAAWLAPVAEEPTAYTEPLDNEWRFQQLFASTPIQIDAVWCRPDHTTTRSPAPPTRPEHRRPRRDLLGLILYSEGWSCRQRGNVIEILPWQ